MISDLAFIKLFWDSLFHDFPWFDNDIELYSQYLNSGLFVFLNLQLEFCAHYVKLKTQVLFTWAISQSVHCG